MPGHTEPSYSSCTWPVAFAHRMACKTTPYYGALLWCKAMMLCPLQRQRSVSEQWEGGELWVNGLYLPVDDAVFHFPQGTICTPITLVPMQQLLRDRGSLSYSRTNREMWSSKCHLVTLKCPAGLSKLEDTPHNKITWKNSIKETLSYLVSAVVG